MKRRMFIALAAAACVCAMDVSLWAKQDAVPGVPVHMVVTIEAKRGKDIPNVEQRDIKVSEEQTPRTVTSFTPLRAERCWLAVDVVD